jgi:hypothetical protein
MEMVFATPPAVSGLHEVHVEVPARTLATLAEQLVVVVGLLCLASFLKKIPAASLSEQIFANEDLGTVLMTALGDHFRGVFGVRLNGLNLLRLSTPVAHLATNGRVKVQVGFFFCWQLSHQPPLQSDFQAGRESAAACVSSCSLSYALGAPRLAVVSLD